MTTATLASGNRTMDTAVVRPRRSLEELVDQLIAAMFKEPETVTAEVATPTETAKQSATRSIHEARRLRQSGRRRHRAGGAGRRGHGQGDAEGDPVGLLRVEADGQAAVRWPGDHGLQPGRGQGRRGGAPGQGRDDGGGRRPGDAVEAGQAGLGAQPPWPSAPERRCVMVTANVGHPGAEGPSPPGRRGRGVGRSAQRKGQGSARASAHSTTRWRVPFTVYADSERWYCFGCGLGGDVLDFIQRMEDLSLTEAIARLDGSPGLAPRAANCPARTRRPASAALPPRNPALLTAAARFYAGAVRRRSAGVPASRGVGPVAAARLRSRLLAGAAGCGRPWSPSASPRSASGTPGCSWSGERSGSPAWSSSPTPPAASSAGSWAGPWTPTRTPRFQAPPGPKPVLGLGQSRSRFAPHGPSLRKGVFDWLAPYRMGSSRLRRPRHPGR